MSQLEKDQSFQQEARILRHRCRAFFLKIESAISVCSGKIPVHYGVCLRAQLEIQQEIH